MEDKIIDMKECKFQKECCYQLKCIKENKEMCLCNSVGYRDKCKYAVILI
jgi:hypothetical protein